MNNIIHRITNITLNLLLILNLTHCSSEKHNLLRIAVIAPIKINVGKSIKNSVIIAKNEINKNGGISITENGNTKKYKIKLFFVDDHYSEISKASVSLRKALIKKKCKFIIGGFSSRVVLPLMNIMAENKTIWLGTGGASPKVIEKIENHYDIYKYYFRVGTMDAVNQGISIANFSKDILKPKGYKKYSILAVNHSYSKYVLKKAKELLKRYGFKKIYEKYISDDEQNIKKYINKAKKADFIVFAFLSKIAHKFILTVHQMKLNYKMPLIGTNAALLSDQYKYSNKFIINHAAMQPQGGPVDLTGNGISIRYTKKYKKIFKHSPYFTGYIAYDTLYILKSAIEKCNSIHPENIIRTMEDNNFEYTGISRYKWKKNHDIYTGVHDGKSYAEILWFQFFKDGKRYCVYPKKYKQRNYTFPGIN